MEAFAYVLGALAAAWPLPLHFASRLPTGTEPAATVPLFNLWSLRWNADRLTHAYAGYWRAPIFHPARGAFAFSEPEPLTGLAFAPVHWLTGNQTVAYNAVLLAALVLNGWAAGRLSRRFGASPGVALAVGLYAQRLPFVIDQLGVLQLVMVWPLLLTIDAALGWAVEGGRHRALLVGAGAAATFATCVYYGLFLVVVLAVGGCFLATRSWVDRRRMVEAALALAAFAALALPWLLAQQRWLAGLRWSAATITSNSALPGDYLSLARGSLGQRVVPWVLDDRGNGQRLYPGTVVVALAVAGWWWARRRADLRPLVRFLLAGLAVTALLSLGLHLHAFGHEPYDAVRRWVPGFARLRSPFRFAVVVQLLLLPLFAMGLQRLRDRPGFGRLAVASLVLVAMAEVSAAPTGLARVPPESTAWSAWLAHRPGPDAVAMIPFAPGPKASQFEPTVEAMLVGLDHGKALVNGYSGFFPDSYDRLAAAARAFPALTALDALRTAAVRWVVVDRQWLTPDRRRSIADTQPLVLRFTGDAKLVYELR